MKKLFFCIKLTAVISIALSFFIANYLKNSSSVQHSDNMIENKSTPYKERYLSWYDEDPILMDQDAANDLYNTLCSDKYITKESNCATTDVVVQVLLKDYIFSQPLHLFVTALINVSKENPSVGRTLKHAYFFPNKSTKYYK